MKSIRTEPLNHAAEGDERIRTAVPSLGADFAYDRRGTTGVKVRDAQRPTLVAAQTALTAGEAGPPVSSENLEPRSDLLARGFSAPAVSVGVCPPARGAA